MMATGQPRTRSRSRGKNKKSSYRELSMEILQILRYAYKRPEGLEPHTFKGESDWFSTYDLSVVMELDEDELCNAVLENRWNNNRNNARFLIESGENGVCLIKANLRPHEIKGSGVKERYPGGGKFGNKYSPQDETTHERWNETWEKVQEQGRWVPSLDVAEDEQGEWVPHSIGVATSKWGLYSTDTSKFVTPVYQEEDETKVEESVWGFAEDDWWSQDTHKQKQKPKQYSGQVREPRVDPNHSPAEQLSRWVNWVVKHGAHAVGVTFEQDCWVSLEQLAEAARNSPSHTDWAGMTAEAMQQGLEEADVQGRYKIQDGWLRKVPRGKRVQRPKEEIADVWNVLGA